MNYQAMAEKAAEIFGREAPAANTRARIEFRRVECEDGVRFRLTVWPRGSNENYLLEPPLTDDERYGFLQEIAGIDRADNLNGPLEAADYLSQHGQTLHANEVLWLLAEVMEAYEIPFTASIDVDKQRKHFESRKLKRSIDLARCTCALNLQIFDRTFSAGFWIEDLKKQEMAEISEFFDVTDLLEIWQAGQVT